jgi:hypothetical protein
MMYKINDSENEILDHNPEIQKHETTYNLDTSGNRR